MLKRRNPGGIVGGMTDLARPSRTQQMLKVSLGALFLGFVATAQEIEVTGPQTEKRFPTLKVPPEFKATLFACDPLIEYPSVLTLGPRSNSIFLAYDYMTGLGEKIIRKDQIRVVEDTNGDGYADTSILFADGFNSIQGLAYHNGDLFVMHSPLLTVLRDRNGDGIADEREDLLTGLGWPPEKSTDRLHGANGVVVGHDGWLYLAVGDRGCDVVRPEGDRLILNGGGILRCRPDGSSLHVFATGLRNIYDIALDNELNVFVRDNENDGGTYMVRVFHSFMGADHGYPYLYEEHPDEAVAPLADLGRGSSAGGIAYLEQAFPAPNQGALFFCEWGRSVVMYRRERKGSGFADMKETEFASGAADDPYGFRPTDIIVDRDGSLLVSDWADGQRPKRGRGRVYRIEYKGQKSKPTEGLDSESYYARVKAQEEIERRKNHGIEELKTEFKRLTSSGRLHAVWIFARARDSETLFKIVESDPDPSVRGQAVRAIGDLFDPVLVEHKLAARRGDPKIAERLAAHVRREDDPTVKLDVTVALGRLAWFEAPDWLKENMKGPDSVLTHAIMQTLRRSRNWPAVLKWLDEPESSPARPIALRAVAGQAEVEVVDGLLRRLTTEQVLTRRREYASLLARVHRKPGPWVYWGFRPKPRRPNTEPWEKSGAIEEALNQILADPNRELSFEILRQIEREKIPARTETLLRWLHDEMQSERVALILHSLDDAPPETVRDTLEAVIGRPAHSICNRLTALKMFVGGLDKSSESRLLKVAGSLEESAVLAEALHYLEQRPTVSSQDLLLRKLQATTAPVRAAAIESLAALGFKNEINVMMRLLSDPDASVRAAAAAAMGTLKVQESAERLMSLVEDTSPTVRQKSLEALAQMREPRAAASALRAFERDEQDQLAALRCLGKVGSPSDGESLSAIASRSRSTEVLQLAAQVLMKWDREEDLARIQGASGIILGWRVSEPLSAKNAASTLESILPVARSFPSKWQEVIGIGMDSRADFGEVNDDAVRLGVSEFSAAEASLAELRCSSSGTLQVWLNGKAIYRRIQPGVYATDSDRVETRFQAGLNRLVTEVSGAGAVRIHARFRRKSAIERHERLSQLSLAAGGNAAHGREIFFNIERPGCSKCHRLGNLGGQVGPDLTGVGRRFTKIHLIESVLEPSRVIAPAFRNILVRLKNGQEVNGVRVFETDSILTLGDGQGQLLEVKKDQIDEQRTSEVSLMPEGLENGLTDEEFVDLIAFLAQQK